jgi:hypothetical protein
MFEVNLIWDEKEKHRFYFASTEDILAFMRILYEETGDFDSEKITINPVIVQTPMQAFDSL